MKKKHTKKEHRNKPSRQWRKLLLIILIALLVLLACRHCTTVPIAALIQPLKPSPSPTQPPPASVNSVVVMKTREQIMREYNRTPPPLPQTLLQPAVRPLPTRAPIQTIPISPPRQTANLGGFTLAALMCLLSLAGFPIPLY